MFPFNLDAADFLGFYAALGTLALVVLALLAGRRARGDARPQRSSATPSAYEIAWLSGGAPAAFATALTALTQRGLVEPDGAEFRTTRDASSETALHPVEREVLRHLPKGRTAALRGVATAPLQLERALIERGLYRPRRGFFDFATEFVPLIGGVLTLGAVRLVWGVQRDKPVGFLALEMLVIGVAAVGIVAAHMGARRTPAGAKLLADLRREASRRGKALVASTKSGAKEGSAPGAQAQRAGAYYDPVSDVALFGTAALAGTALAPVHTSLAPYERRHTQHASSNTNHAGSGCGGGLGDTSSSHSDGGASSCGGGGGCGGGGCGGCGS